MNDLEDDMAKIHENLSVQCFNSAWDLIDRTDRTPAEDEEMLRLSMASCWHWTQRLDCTDQSLSIAYWQVSRIHSILGRADEARRYGELCLAASQGKNIAPFALAYAYEALARAEALGNNEAKMLEYIAQAKGTVTTISNLDTQKMVLDDLATIS